MRGPLAPPPPPVSFANGVPHLAVERFTLPSGLEVVVHSDPSLPQVAVSTWYGVGAGDEPAGSSGRAHLFEHLFKNSANLGGRHHYEILRSIGASDANASTSADRTAYHQVVPAHQLEVALWLESDRMGYFLPAMTQGRLEAQQQVVRSERRQRYENVPYGAERFAAAAALYPPDDPLHHLVIGCHQHIAATTLEDIFTFYRTWYVPANAHLVLAGAITAAEARRLVERYYGSFPASTPPPRRTAAAPDAERAATRAREIELEDRFASLERLHWVWPGPAAHGPEGTALEVLASAWSAAGTGALWKRLVYREQLAQRVSVWTVNHRRGSELHAAVDLRSGVSLERVRQAFDEELARLRGEPLPAAAIARVVGRREAGVLWGLQNLARRAADLQRHWMWSGDPNGFAAEAARFAAVTPQAVQEAAERWLSAAARTTIHTAARARLTSGAAPVLALDEPDAATG